MERSFALPAEAGAAARGEGFPLLARLLRPPLRRVLASRFDLAVEGLQHVPLAGGCLVAANHHNYLDGVVLAVTVPRPLAFLVMPRVYRASPVHPWLHDHIGSIELRTDRADPGALRRALAALRAGRALGIFPEGPFSVRGQLEPGLRGVALLALRAGVPVVPAGILGTYEALAGRRAYLPRRHPLAIRFGPPRRFGPGDGGDARTARARVTGQIMDDIAGLLAGADRSDR
jgi:1-acyl-sn-glycerol-3-phosphate acyltransferase